MSHKYQTAPDGGMPPPMPKGAPLDASPLGPVPPAPLYHGDGGMPYLAGELYEGLSTGPTRAPRTRRRRTRHASM